MHRLTRLVPKRWWWYLRTRSTPGRVIAEDLLPTEVWELVFEELPDESLLTAARFCHAWNDGSGRHTMTLASVRRDFYPFGFPRPIPSALHALPQLRSLACEFRGFRVPCDMKYLHALIAKCGQLQQLSLSWDWNGISPAQRTESWDSMARILCNILRKMVQKTRWPLVVIVDARTFIVDRRALAQWGPRIVYPMAVYPVNRFTMWSRTIWSRMIHRPHLFLLLLRRSAHPSSVALVGASFVILRRDLIPLFEFGTDEMVELCEGLYKDVGSPERPPVKCSVLNREAKRTGKRNDGSPESCSVRGPWALNALQLARLGVFDVEDFEYQNCRPRKPITARE
ncbi:hypothetical protein B0H13DRAFT_2284257 [Mycena leptocephala]|nr:hypothetical protein B0H13DRAFT_2284257 [Mycena leptocephala]